MARRWAKVTMGAWRTQIDTYSLFPTTKAAMLFGTNHASWYPGREVLVYNTFGQIVYSSTDDQLKGRAMKKLRKRQEPKQIKEKLFPTYDGKLVTDAHGWYEDDDLTEYTAQFTLVHMDDAPDHPTFPKLDRVPPSTFYAFDEDTKRVNHLVSFDMRRAALAWDMDDSGVYFTRCKRGIVAPRYVEYCWDSSNAFAAREEWNIHHPNYRGSIRNPRKEPQELIPPRSTEKPKQRSTATATKPKHKPLPKKLTKKDFDATPDHDLIKDDGSVDKAALDAAATDVASKFASSFGKKKLRKFKK